MQRVAQRGEVWEYVQEFFELMLQIYDLREKEAFFSFMDGLKPQAKQELQRRGVQDLTKAMTIIESLIEFKKLNSTKTKRKSGGDKDGQKKVVIGSHRLRGSLPRMVTRRGNHLHVSCVKVV